MEIRCGSSLSPPGYFTALPRLFPGHRSRIYVPVSRPPIGPMRIWAPWHRSVFIYLHFEVTVCTLRSDWANAICIILGVEIDDASKDQRDAHATMKSVVKFVPKLADCGFNAWLDRTEGCESGTH